MEVDLFGTGPVESMDLFATTDAFQPPSLSDCGKGITLEDFLSFDETLNGKVLTEEEYNLQFEEFMNARRNT